ncbi:MAG: hypothetical protein V8R55_12295 [Dysosmobacter sp.]
MLLRIGWLVAVTLQKSRIWFDIPAFPHLRYYPGCRFVCFTDTPWIFVHIIIELLAKRSIFSLGISFPRRIDNTHLPISIHARFSPSCLFQNPGN